MRGDMPPPLGRIDLVPKPPAGSPEEALDCAYGLYLNNPPPGSNPQRTNAEDHAPSMLAGERVRQGGWEAGA